LGKEEQGISARLAVTKRSENLGLGIDPKASSSSSAAPLEDNWWEKAFETASKQLPSSTSSPTEPSTAASSKRKVSNASSSSNPSVHDEELEKMTPADRELFLRCGGRRLSRRAGRDMPGKRKRVAKADAVATMTPLPLPPKRSRKTSHQD